jgi:hypothetical protein
MNNDIESLIKSWVKKNNNTKGKFFQKLIIHWPEIVADKKIARYSIPGKIINDNNKLILQIYSYNGSATIQLQSKIKQIKQNIKLHIGYFPIYDLKIIQKSTIFV